MLLEALLIAGCSGSGHRGAAALPGPLHERFADAAEGNAFESPIEQGTSAPIRRTDFAGIALVRLRNLTSRPVRVIGAEPVWSDKGVVIRGFGLSPPGATTPGATRDEHFPNSIAISKARPIEPSSGVGDSALLTFEVLLQPPADEGVMLGVDVFYEQGREVRRQRWPLVILVCDLATHPSGCQSYKGRPTADLDFEPMVAEALAGEG